MLAFVQRFEGHSQKERRTSAESMVHNQTASLFAFIVMRNFSKADMALSEWVLLLTRGSQTNLPCMRSCKTNFHELTALNI